MSNTFSELGIKKDIVEALKLKKITEPTHIQDKIIPLLIENKDVIAQSATGTGKTFGYLLPLFEKLETTLRKTQAIIIVPTHELAVQVNAQVDYLEKNSETKLSGAIIVGKVNIERQIKKLKEKPEIIIGTSGRILELIKKKKISAHTVKTVIIDEADRLLDDHNIEDLKAVLKTTMKQTQIVMVSATITNKALEKAKDILKDPELIKEEKFSVPSTIEHLYFLTEEREKATLFRKLVRSINPVKAIAFVNKTFDISIITEKLQYHGLRVEDLSSENKKIDRKKVMDDFRNGKIQVVISSDIGARGLDFQDVTHIFNFDMPQGADTFLHRVGRTGRNGKSGVSISIITKREEELIKLFNKKLKIDIQFRDMFEGEIIDKERPSKPSNSKSYKNNSSKKTNSKNKKKK